MFLDLNLIIEITRF